MAKKRGLSLYLGGAVIGIFNGLLGGGGGMVAVPLLQRGANYSAQTAHATAIAVILPVSLASGIVYLLHRLVPLRLFLPVALGVLGGGFGGAKLLSRISGQSITLLFALLMLAAGVRMLF